MVNPKLIILVGLPASGKSTFCSKFKELNEFKENIIIVNQDLLKTKSKCLKLIDSSLLDSSIEYIIVDRCHLTSKDREIYRDNYPDFDKYCVFFDTALDICKQRIVCRVDHPTITPKNGPKILNMVKNKLVKPDINKEKWFTNM